MSRVAGGGAAHDSRLRTVEDTVQVGALKVASLFSGIGGLELGIQRAGAGRAILFCEVWAPARAVLEKQFGGVEVAEDVQELADFAGADLVAAGFPCTDLSQAGRTKGFAGEQSRLVLDVLDVIDREKPAWVLLENVPNLLHLGNGGSMAILIDRLERAGYRWAYRVVDSRFTGLAQRRRRVFILAAQDHDPAPLLLQEDAGSPSKVTHRVFGFSWTEGNRGVGWAEGAVPTLRGGTTVSVASPPGIWVPANRRGRRIVRPSIRVAERLQGFDAGWTSAAPKRDRWKLVGNAVSVPVAEWIGERLTLRDQDLPVPPGRLFGVGERWPHAAYGNSGGRFAVDGYSEYPRHAESAQTQDLAVLLRARGAEPLSHRATKGFRDRLKGSGLKVVPGFVAALDEHVEATASRRE